MCLWDSDSSMYLWMWLYLESVNVYLQYTGDLWMFVPLPLLAITHYSFRSRNSLLGLDLREGKSSGIMTFSNGITLGWTKSPGLEHHFHYIINVGSKSMGGSASWHMETDGKTKENLKKPNFAKRPKQKWSARFKANIYWPVIYLPNLAWCFAKQKCLLP